MEGNTRCRQGTMTNSLPLLLHLTHTPMSIYLADCLVVYLSCIRHDLFLPLLPPLIFFLYSFPTFLIHLALPFLNRSHCTVLQVLSAICQTNLPAPLLKAFIDEVEMLASLRHPNICLYMAACIEPPNRAIVTELVSRGSLWEVLRTPSLFEVLTLHHII